MEQSKKGNGRTVFLVITNLLSVACLLWTLHDAKLSELKDDLATMNWWWVALAAAADIGVYCWHGWRWSLLLRPVVAVDVWHTVRAIYVGLFANEVLPFRVGELLRCYLLSRWTSLPFSVAISSAMIERVFDGIWMYACLLVALKIVDIPPQLRYLNDAAYILGVVVFVGALVIAIALFQRHWARAFLTGASWKRRIAVLLDDLALMGHSKYLIRAFGQSLPYLLLQVIPIWAAAQGYGFTLTITDAFVVMVFLRLATSIPSAPGNLGLFQVLIRECLQRLYDVPAAEAARFSLVLWGIVTLPLLIGGFVAFTITGMKIGELRTAATQEALNYQNRPES